MVPPSLFILAFSVCRCLQCLVSTLTQGGGGGHLFGLRCSVVLWERRDTANKRHWRVWGMLTADGPHWVCHSRRQCVLPGSTLLRLQGAVQAHCPTWALRFLHFPRLSRSGSGVPRKGTDLDGLCVPCPSQVRAAQQTRCLATGPPEVGNVSYSPAQLLVPGCLGPPWEQPQVCGASPLGSWSQAVTLLADVNRPGSQEDEVSKWEPAHGLVEDAVSGPKIAAAPCLLALALACCLSTSRDEGPYRQLACSLLFFAQSFVLWACQGSLCGDSVFHGKGLSFFFFFLVSLVIAWLGVAISHLLPQFILRAIRPHPYPKDGWCSPHLPAQPPLTGRGCQASGPLLHWWLWIGVYSVVLFFFPFSLPVLLSSEILKLPIHTPVSWLLTVWRLLLLPDSLPKTGFCP